jgi:small subunit ribosomal protein S20
MNKKQRNQKLVAQNNRNRIINKRYRSTIKSLFKLFSFKIKEFNPASNNHIEEIKKLNNLLFSVIDKAIKKNVIHKNTAARKKSKISKLISILN